MVPPKAYLDNNVVCGIGKDDQKGQSEALDKLLELSGGGKLQILTSQLSKEEMDRCSKQDRMKLPNRIYNLLSKGPFLADHTVVGFSNNWGPRGGVSCPLVEDDAIAKVLWSIGLDRTDSHHLMLAIRDQCEYFITCDQRTILKHRAAIEQKFPIKPRLPSELVLEMEECENQSARE